MKFKGLNLRTILFPFLVATSMIAGIFMGFHLKAIGKNIGIYGIPIGLFFMIYPAMTKVGIEKIARSFKDLKSVGLMVFLNYAVAPFLVAGLAYFFFYLLIEPLKIYDHSIISQVIVGIILLGVAPCIAMVMVWTDMARGNLSMGVSFVAWNSVLQVITTPFLVYYLARTSVFINPLLILESVILYLISPLIAGNITRKLLIKKRNFSKILNLLGNVQNVALLFTIVIIFWTEGSGIINYPSLIWMVGIVMILFYFILFNIGYLSAKKLNYNYEDSTALGFTVAARDFEVSIAIALVAFSAYPFVAITTAIGPLLEIPLMLIIVAIQLMRRRKSNKET